MIADEYFLGAYAGDAPDRTVPDISPVFAVLNNLPPILIVIGAEDVLFEDNLAMAARLVAAGVEVDLRVYPASPHAFTGHATSMAQWLRGQIGETLQLDSRTVEVLVLVPAPQPQGNSAAQ